MNTKTFVCFFYRIDLSQYQHDGLVFTQNNITYLFYRARLFRILYDKNCSIRLILKTIK